MDLMASSFNRRSFIFFSFFSVLLTVYSDFVKWFAKGKQRKRFCGIMGERKTARLCMIRLHPVKREEKDRLFSLNQKYLYEMTLYYPDEMDEKGNLHYGHFEEYFIDPERKAFFLYEGEKMVGFAMIHPYSVLDRSPDFTLAEFTIFPSFRGRGYGEMAAKEIFSAFRGVWEVKFNEKNSKAKSLWTKVTKPYSPKVYHLNEVETVLEFETF